MIHYLIIVSNFKIIKNAHYFSLQFEVCVDGTEQSIN